MWRWEKSESFDLRLQELQDNKIEIPMTWVDCYGNQAKVSGEIAACDYDSFQRIRMRVLRYISRRWKLMMGRGCMVFCSGCAIMLALTGAGLSDIMEPTWAEPGGIPPHITFSWVRCWTMTVRRDALLRLLLRTWELLGRMWLSWNVSCVRFSG